MEGNNGILRIFYETVNPSPIYEIISRKVFEKFIVVQN